MEGMFNAQALNANVIIKEEVVKNVSAAGVDYTSATDKNEKYREGIVVSIGEHLPVKRSRWAIVRWFDKGTPYVKVGDRVSFDNYKATNYTMDAIEYKVVYYADLFLLK